MKLTVGALRTITMEVGAELRELLPGEHCVIDSRLRRPSARVGLRDLRTSYAVLIAVGACDGHLLHCSGDHFNVAKDSLGRPL